MGTPDSRPEALADVDEIPESLVRFREGSLAIVTITGESGPGMTSSKVRASSE